MTAAVPPAIHVADLGVAFGGVHAVDRVAMTVPAGEHRAVIGPNGAGKTTLFNLIGGQLRPDSGTVRLHGDDVTRLPAHRRVRRGLARTFQITDLFAGLTVHENVLLAVAAGDRAVTRTFWRPLFGLPEPRKRTRELLRRWDLWSERDREVSALAYGRQRVLEIVLALASDPSVLLLDEPTAGLAAADAALMVDLTRALPEDLTLLLIEHDMEVAFGLADTITVLMHGAILAQGSPEQIRGNEEVVTAYLGELGGGSVDAARG